MYLAYIYATYVNRRPRPKFQSRMALLASVQDGGRRWHIGIAAHAAPNKNKTEVISLSISLVPWPRKREREGLRPGRQFGLYYKPSCPARRCARRWRR